MDVKQYAANNLCILCRHMIAVGEEFGCGKTSDSISAVCLD
jgi:hypothetical protein